MNIITLTSDRTINDFSIGRTKGEILRNCPNVNIIDLAHDVPLFNTKYASFVIKHSYSSFPKGTVHIIGVDNEAGENQKHLVAKAYEQFFICADNGILALIFDKDEIDAVYTPTVYKSDDTSDLIFLAQIATRIINQEPEEYFLRPVDKFLQKKMPSTVEYKNQLRGKVIYIDSYGNAITNISRELFEYNRKNRNFVISAATFNTSIRKINKTYIEARLGQHIALFNSFGLLEIAICKGKIVPTLNLKLDSEVIINFE